MFFQGFAIKEGLDKEFDRIYEILNSEKSDTSIDVDESGFYFITQNKSLGTSSEPLYFRNPGMFIFIFVIMCVRNLVILACI